MRGSITEVNIPESIMIERLAKDLDISKAEARILLKESYQHENKIYDMNRKPAHAEEVIR